MDSNTHFSSVVAGSQDAETGWSNESRQDETKTSEQPWVEPPESISTDAGADLDDGGDSYTAGVANVEECPSPEAPDNDPFLGSAERPDVSAHPDDCEVESDPIGDNIAQSQWKYYGEGFRVSTRGVFVRRINKEDVVTWEQISTTPIHIEALTRDRRGENWGTHLTITNRDGKSRQLAISHALIAAEKTNDIASTLAALGVGVVFGKSARQAIVEFLTTEVSHRITSVAQIGWHESDSRWVFVLADRTLVPAGFEGARPVLQTAAIQNQTGLCVSGTVTEWADQIARPLAQNSNIHLCVGTAFAGPLLYWANEPPGFFHLCGASKIAKSLAAAIGQSVWGRPKVPGEADAFGVSWTATSVGLERYAVLRSDVGASFDEIGEGQAKVIRSAIYVLANGSTKLRGTQDVNLRPTESFRILGISTGEPTMEAFLAAGGESVPAGLSVRLVDVPAEVQPGSAFETCAIGEIEEIGRLYYPLTTQLHGAVGQYWLQCLVELGPEEIQRQLREHRDAWLSLPAVAAVRMAGTAQVRSVLNRFALVAAALRMAIDAGMLPWSMGDTDLGIAACMVRWAKARKGRLDLAGEIVSAVEQIREILVANLHGRFIHLRIDEVGHRLEYASQLDENKRDTLGYVKGDRILIEATAWRSELCRGFDPEKTARHLRDEGLLLTDKGKLQRQEKVLRGGESGNGRFYVLDMRILEDAAGTGPRDN
ncbi:DUF927 domain-containing protein [Methylobacterium nigriterrae]|uniref:DUF927 domain-containing protein n=1 Tax=Methylobacterium nigriterrae TaxID=3127512 RepID=UPI003013ADC5